jgi:hypothetical protein
VGFDDGYSVQACRIAAETLAGMAESASAAPGHPLSYRPLHCSGGGLSCAAEGPRVLDMKFGREIGFCVVAVRGAKVSEAGCVFGVVVGVDLMCRMTTRRPAGDDAARYGRTSDRHFCPGVGLTLATLPAAPASSMGWTDFLACFMRSPAA